MIKKYKIGDTFKVKESNRLTVWEIVETGRFGRNINYKIDRDDNEVWISQEELEEGFELHTTSKFNSIDDAWDFLPIILNDEELTKYHQLNMSSLLTQDDMQEFLTANLLEWEE